MEPGQGFEVVKTDRGDLWISGYMLARYLNQLPPDQTFVDHLGREHVIDTRNDIQWHRVQVFLKGFVYSRRLRYTVNFWTVNATNQVAIAGTLWFAVNKAINLGVGVNGMPGAHGRGVASVLAGPRPRHGRRALPARLHVGRLDRRRAAGEAALQLPWSART